MSPFPKLIKAISKNAPFPKIIEIIITRKFSANISK